MDYFMTHITTPLFAHFPINEDQYSNLTLIELFEKLGTTKFLEYLEFILTKTVSNLKSETNFNNTSPIITTHHRLQQSIRYKQLVGDMPEELTLIWLNNKELSISYYLNFKQVWFNFWLEKEKNISMQLSAVVTHYYALPEAKKLRIMATLMKAKDVVRSFRIFQLAQNKFIVQALSPSNDWDRWIGPYTTPQECCWRMISQGTSSDKKFVVIYKNKKPKLIGNKD